MFEDHEAVVIALSELHRLGTTWWRSSEEDERFAYLYLALLDHYESEGRPEEFQQFCAYQLAAPQLEAVRKKVIALMA
jgi:hypothetical protein